MGDVFDNGGELMDGKRPGLVKHHILSVSIYPEYRDEAMNHIWMSAYDHTMNGERCPHGSLPRKRQAWNRWLRDCRPEQFRWANEHSRRALDLGE